MGCKQTIKEGNKLSNNVFISYLKDMESPSIPQFGSQSFQHEGCLIYEGVPFIVYVRFTSSWLNGFKDL